MVNRFVHAFADLVGLRASNGYDDALGDKLQIGRIEPDKLRTSERSCEADKNDCPVTCPAIGLRSR
jgi:hypothetical protein